MSLRCVFLFFFLFLDAFSHLYKRVYLSVCPSVRPLHTSWIFEKFAEIEQNSIRNKKICHLKDDSKTNTRAVFQNASVVRTLFDLFYNHRSSSNEIKVRLRSYWRSPMTQGNNHLSEVNICKLTTHVLVWRWRSTVKSYLDKKESFSFILKAFFRNDVRTDRCTNKPG